MKMYWRLVCSAIFALFASAPVAMCQGVLDQSVDSHYDSVYWLSTGTDWVQGGPVGVAQSGDATGVTLSGLIEALWADSISLSNGYETVVEFVGEQPSGTYVVDKNQACAGTNRWPSFWAGPIQYGAFYPGNTTPGRFGTNEFGMHFVRSAGTAMPNGMYTRILCLVHTNHPDYAALFRFKYQANDLSYYWIENNGQSWSGFTSGNSDDLYIAGTSSFYNVPTMCPYPTMGSSSSSYYVDRYYFIGWVTDANNNLLSPDPFPQAGAASQVKLHLARYGVYTRYTIGLSPLP